MDTIIINALSELLNDVKARVPKTKVVNVEHGLDSCTLAEAVEFAKSKNIPFEDIVIYEKEASICSNVYLAYDKVVDLTEDEIIERERKDFNINAHSRVSKAMIAAGYRRISGKSCDFSLYDAFVSGEFGKIVSYFEEKYE